MYVPAKMITVITEHHIHVLFANKTKMLQIFSPAAWKKGKIDRAAGDWLVKQEHVTGGRGSVQNCGSGQCLARNLCRKGAIVMRSVSESCVSRVLTALGDHQNSRPV